MAEESEMFAPGWPGIPARWTSSAKSGARHGRQPRQPRLVHAEPRHSQRDLLPARRSRLHARPRVHRHRRRDVLLGGEAGCPLRDVAGRARRAGVPDSQHGRRRPLPDREGGADRPVARRRAAARPVRAAAGHARGLPPVRAAGAAPGQPGQRQHGVGRRLQGHADAARRARQLRAGAGVLGAVARPIGRVRRRVRRMAAAAGEQTTDAHATRARRTATSPSPARSISTRRTACSCWRSASARRRWKPVSTRSSACSRTSTRRSRRTSPGGRRGTRRSEAARRRTASRRAASITSARRCCARTSRSASKAASSPACRFPGASPRATTTSAGIT